ncbi:MAG TPA: hypothetical protein PKZ76_02520 [Xanthomonadaceae bacterium]|nr:hypothetical protein [Xanthomonadaceae bacterium]
MAIAHGPVQHVDDPIPGSQVATDTEATASVSRSTWATDEYAGVGKRVRATSSGRTWPVADGVVGPVEATCLTDTTQGDFEAGHGDNVDLDDMPGSVALAHVPILDQEHDSIGEFGVAISTTNWVAQTFEVGVSGLMTGLDVALLCGACSGNDPPIKVEIRNTTGGFPGNTVLASATIPGFSSAMGTYYAATLATPVWADAGDARAIVVYVQEDREAGTYAALRSNANTYANGSRFTSTNGGGNWTASATDHGFRTYLRSYIAAGSIESALKDSEPDALVTSWTSLAWVASTPMGTDVAFQVAASTSTDGPFVFVGPDGSPDSFFIDGDGSLSQFKGMRYLKTKGFLATSDHTTTPYLDAVTVCHELRAGVGVFADGFESGVSADSRPMHASND